MTVTDPAVHVVARLPNGRCLIPGAQFTALIHGMIADAIASLLVRVDHANTDLNSRPLLKRRYERLVDAGRVIGMNL